MVHAVVLYPLAVEDDNVSVSVSALSALASLYRLLSHDMGAPCTPAAAAMDRNGEASTAGVRERENLRDCRKCV